MGATATGVARQLDPGRHQRDPAQHPGRALVGTAERAAMSIDIDPFELVDPERHARRGYPHDVWTRLRAEAPVAYLTPDGFEPFWAITKHTDVMEIAKQPLRFSSAR